MQVKWYPLQPFERAGLFFIMTVEEIKKEIERRLSFVRDALIGQSPEDLERHYTLIGKQDAFNGLLEFIANDVQSFN